MVLLLAAACGDAGAPDDTPAPPTVVPATTVPPATTSPSSPPDAGTAPPPTVDAPRPTAAASTTTSTISSVDDVVLALERVAAGLGQPVFVDAPAGDGRLFIVDQPGVVWVVDEARTAVSAFLDIRDLVSFGGERGLLGLAFHPDFAGNGRLFVHYSDRDGDTALVEYRVAADDPDRADPESARRLLAVDQPAGNHNGGMVEFGPDGMLYVALGDGGAANDRFGNGQRPDTLLGTILRLDVDGGDPYAIPSGNPFADGGDGAPEVWAYGLRNPWRFAFDPDGGLLYIADVGQGEWEEVNVAAAGAAGVNYGWPIMEGEVCFASPGCTADGLALPEIVYDHGEGCSVTGGYVYRGSALPELAGHYFYGDFCTGFVRSWHRDTGRSFDWTGQLGRIGGLSSFGTDAAGELYVTSTEGEVWRIVRG